MDPPGRSRYRVVGRQVTAGLKKTRCSHSNTKHHHQPTPASHVPPPHDPPTRFKYGELPNLKYEKFESRSRETNRGRGRGGGSRVEERKRQGRKQPDSRADSSSRLALALAGVAIRALLLRPPAPPASESSFFAGFPAVSPGFIHFLARRERRRTRGNKSKLSIFLPLPLPLPRRRVLPSSHYLEQPPARARGPKLAIPPVPKGAGPSSAGGRGGD